MSAPGRTEFFFNRRMSPKQANPKPLNPNLKSPKRSCAKAVDRHEDPGPRAWGFEGCYIGPQAINPLARPGTLNPERYLTALNPGKPKNP